MKELKRNIAHILALCLMLTSIIPTYAAGITLPEWSIVLEETENEEAVLMAAAGPQDPVSYLDWDEGQKKLVPATCSNYIVIASGGEYSFNADTWYVVKGEVTITNRITNKGTEKKPAHLILTDGCTFNVPAGIRNETRKEYIGGTDIEIVNALVIYGQTNNSGILQIDEGTENDAGIGGGSQNAGGTITINGGTVNVTKKGLGAGIGGGTGGAGGTITINGGTVDATGGGDAAGIGGCKEAGGTITINGGTVTAIGGSGGSGIGGGNSKAGGTIKISGGKVIAIASGSNGGAGIGGGNGGACGTIEISGGEVTAIGGSGGAGIGGGNYDTQSIGSAGGTITISGGTVDATGGGNAAGIGGGHSGSGETIRISEGTIKATGGSGGAGIGGGNGGDGGIIEISGGTVTAMVGLDTSTGGAGIGGGNGGKGGTITISGGTVTALATASNGGAGIGGGNGKAGGTITISGGTVTALATGSNAGVGNGAGYGGSGGTLSIEYTPVILLAGQNRASASTRSKDDYRTNHQNYPFALISYSTFVVDYTVEHHLQKEIKGEEYALVEKDTKTEKGIPGTIAQATANEYPGYKLKNIEQKPIALDGSTVVEVKYDIIYYTVTFDVNGHGVGSLEKDVLPGEKVEKPSAPTADGCVFVGWYTDQKCSAGKEYDFSTPVTGSFTLYAKWLIVVTLDAKGGSGGTGSVNAEVGLAMPSITVPKRQEYLFGGYFTEEEGNGTRYYNADGTSARTWDLEEPKTLYAYWISTPSPKKQFIVSFDSKGGSAVPAQLVASGSTASDATPSRTGYRFDGWYANEDYSGEAWKFDTDTVTEDIILYAKWTPEKYTISWCDENGAVLTTSSADHGTLPVCPDESLFVKEGYIHTGWTPAVEVATKSVSYKATYERKLDGYHVVSFDPRGGSAVPAQLIADGSTVKAVSSAQTGYTLSGWFINGDYSGNAWNFAADKVTEDIILYAKWTPEKYTISWCDENGAVRTTSSADHGTLPVCPDESLFVKEGYVQTGWDPAVEVATKSVSYKATYERKLDGYHVVSFDPRGGSAVAAVIILDGHTLASAETPDRTGYDFNGWKKPDGSAFGFGTEPVTADITLTASWTAKKYVITWSVDGTTSTTPCAYGELPAYSGSTAKAGYVFTGWSPAIKAVTENASYTAQYTHVHMPEKIPRQKATCTADGWNDYYQCQGEGSCSAYFADFKCTSKIENLDDWKTGTGKIPAAGHKAVMIPQKDATTEADGYKAHWYCTACSTYFKDDSGSVGAVIGNAEALASWKNGEGRIEKTKPHAHAYGTATYLWGEDLSTCTAYHTCTEAACGHTEFETGTVTEESGKMKATFTNPAFETQTKAKPTPGHTHTFSGVWSTNEAAHWHAATCEHTDLAKDMAAHAWGTGDNTNKCTVCGYEKTSPEPEKVLVSFNTDGGSFVKTQVVAKGQKAARPADPAKSGYVFVDWFTNTDRTNVYDFSTAVSADITLFAKWQKNVGREYTITWKDWNGTILATSKVVESGLPDYPGTSNPSRSGYIFTGWTPKIGLATADQMYTAVYAPQTVVISGGGSSSGNSTPAAKKPTVTFSSNWFTNEPGVWRIKNSAGQVVTNAWLCDDAVAANGQNVWYLLTQDGAMLAAGLVQDNTGNFYSLETNHDGYFGMLRYRDGYYNCNGQQVYLKFSKNHDGTFGAVTNPDGIEKLKAIYGVTQYGIGNDNAVYTKTF